jgi:hypothetical protein
LSFISSVLLRKLWKKKEGELEYVHVWDSI